MPSLKKDPSLKDIQEYIRIGGEELGFDTLNAFQRCLMLGEEVGELYKSIRKHEGITVDSKTSPIEEEIADVLLQLCAVANYYHIDIEQSFRKKQQLDKGRGKK